METAVGKRSPRRGGRKKRENFCMGDRVRKLMREPVETNLFT